MSEDYVKTSGTSGYFCLDTNDEADSDDGHNMGFKVRKLLIQDNAEVKVIIASVICIVLEKNKIK